VGLGLLSVSGAAFSTDSSASGAPAPQAIEDVRVVARDCGNAPGWMHLRRMRLPKALSEWPAYTSLAEHQVSSAGHCVPVFTGELEPELPYTVKLMLRKGAAPGSLYAMTPDLWAFAQRPLEYWKGLEGHAAMLPPPAAACRASLLDLQGRTVAFWADGAMLIEVAGEWLRLESVDAIAGRQTFAGQRRFGPVVVDHKVVMEGLRIGEKLKGQIPVAVSYEASTFSYPDAQRVTSKVHLLLGEGCGVGSRQRGLFERLLYWLKH
jgi:hypothetical protein